MKKLLDRNPTEEMENEGIRIAGNIREIWQAMFDAAPELTVDMEPVEFDDYPDYHQEAMGCGLEDRGIRDRYEAMAYGWYQAVERVAERIPKFHTSDQLSAAVEAEQNLRYEENRNYNRNTNDLIERHAAQLAAQQAENEELKNVAESWESAAHRSAHELGAEIAKLTAERDELIGMLKHVKAYGTLSAWLQQDVDEAFAKHEGEKHVV